MCYNKKKSIPKRNGFIIFLVTSTGFRPNRQTLDIVEVYRFAFTNGNRIADTLNERVWF